ncbi:MAG: HigA family addiction module antitoxin [Treponema sp.]|nr:HigA family addiction module antitoxin [Treponema sp.]
MQKNNLTPGKTLKAFLEKNGLNCNRLAKVINMSNAMVRLLVLDKSPISMESAFRLAKFFKNKPEYWLELQLQYDLAMAYKDKVLAKELSGITDVSKYKFVRKPHAPRTNKKITAKSNAVPAKAAPAVKNNTTAKKPAAAPVPKK